MTNEEKTEANKRIHAMLGQQHEWQLWKYDGRTSIKCQRCGEERQPGLWPGDCTPRTRYSREHR